MCKEVEIICFGVGFGDCIYVKLPNNTQILIDTGHNGAFSDVITKLETEKRNIDYVFLTHSHGDHIGGIGQLIDNTYLKIKGIYYWTPVDTKISKTNLLKIEKLRNISVNKHRMIHCEQLDEDVKERMYGIFDHHINILYPITYNIHEYSTTDLNANSIVIDVIVDGYHLLFMGDATSEKEQMIIDKCIEDGIDLRKTIFWKIGHHASETASSGAFVNAILGNTFKKAICSCKDTWTFDPDNNEPPSVSKINEINTKLSPYGERINFTGESRRKRDIKLKFRFDGGNVTYVP